MAGCPENCKECTDDGTTTRCKYDECEAGYVYKVADGTCNRQLPTDRALHYIITLENYL